VEGPPDAPALDRGVNAPSELLVRGLKVFSSPPGQPRARRATDLVLLLSSLAALAVIVAAYPPGGFEVALQRLLAAVPDWLDPVWGLLSHLTWFFALVLLVIALVRRRFVVLLQAVGSLVLAAAVGVLVVRIAVGSWPDLSDALLGSAGAPRFPYVRLAEAAAVVVAAAPHLAHPWRRTGRWVLGLGAVGVAVTAAGTPLGALAALLIGVAAAAGARLIGGTSAGRPGIDDVEAALVQLGVVAHDLEIAEHQVAGVFHVRGVDRTGRRLLVKIYGRDAHDTQLLATLWRNTWYRGRGLPLRLGRLQAVEHEAFVTLLARGAGVSTHEVVTAAATIDDDAVLVLRGDASPFSALEPELIDDAALRAAWQALAQLDGAKIAHQQIEPATIVIVDGTVGLSDFARATVAPDEAQLATDRAQLHVTLAAVAGSARANTAVVDALGPAGAAELLPYLQTAAFSPALRRQLKAAGIDVDDVRDELAEAVGVEPPDPIKIRRVTWWSAIQLALLALASYTIVDAASGVEWSEVRSSVADATWGWIVVAFVVAQLPRLTQSLTTLGSVPTSLPFGPVYAMQLAMGYMNVALPSNLARMVINIRFFQRQGLSPPVAVASGAIDSFFGTVVQCGLLVLLLLFSESSIAFDVSVPSGATWKLGALIVAFVIGAVLVVTLVPRIRNPIVGAVRKFWPDVRRALGALRASRKLALLVLGSLGTELLFALALGLFAQAFGYDISLAELLVINISVSLLATIVPIPGGVGVAEFGLTLGLTAAGMEPEAAIAAVLLYRISTFYLPPLWGFFAMQWLQRNRYL
jgi:uncharacterized protein (TIRG00374 family)